MSDKKRMLCLRFKFVSSNQHRGCTEARKIRKAQCNGFTEVTDFRCYRSVSSGTNLTPKNQKLLHMIKDNITKEIECF